MTPNKLLIVTTTALFLGVGGVARADSEDRYRNIADGRVIGFTLSSPDLQGPNGNAFTTANVLNGFGCTGGNVSPALGTDLSRWSAREIGAVAHALNSRPRKTLGWRTPAEVLNEYLRFVQQPGVATTG